MTPVSFSYGALEPDLAKHMRRARMRILTRLKRTTSDMLETGRDLATIRAAVSGSVFGLWVVSECGITSRTAQLFMRASEVFGERCEIISQIPPTSVMKLAAPNVPDNVREMLVNRLTSGDRLRNRDIDEAVREARPAKPTCDSEWNAAREVAAAMASVRRKAKFSTNFKTEDDELLLADFYAAWGALPSYLRSQALRDIDASDHLEEVLS
ncbi:hypothetical protein [Mesorhizobium sp. INR15]|uniref:hypothetical protein n=1 Tax=Mesorhizobium sp. INR15 TaxID=2654248 RepID=UPI0018966843|nr:hypothetical protein [Mesorhizobium sp. INR15]QPC90296.1 hypothetical protein GA829_06660 [Mesorhizobium sp. INR15]